MSICRWFGALTVLGAVTLGVSAYAQQASDRPTWKAFDPDEKGVFKPFWQKMDTDTDQTMTVQAMKVQQKQSQTFWVKWTPKKKEGNTWQVDYEIVGVKMNIQIGGNSIDYDSFAKEQQPQNPLTDFFKALVGSKFTFTIVNDPKEGIKVTDVEGLQGFVSKLASTNEQLKPLLETILSKDALKQMSNPTFAAFPKSDEEFKKGSWTSGPVTLNMGPIGSYETEYTYTAKKNDPTKIDVSGTMKYTAPKSTDAQGLPFTIKEGTLTANKISGAITIDPKLGRLLDSVIDMELTGKLKIDIAGMVTEVDLTQKQKSSLKTLDADPVPSKK